MAEETPTTVDTGVLDANPELSKMVKELQAEKGQLLKKSASVRQQREMLLKQIQPLEAKLRTVDEEIKQIERPRMAQIDQQLGMLAKAMGGKSMGISSPQQ